MSLVPVTLKKGGYAIAVNPDGVQTLVPASASAALLRALEATTQVLSRLRNTPEGLERVMNAVLAEMSPCECAGCLAKRAAGEQPSRQEMH